MNFLQKFPSITDIFQNSWNTFKRFPYAVLSAFSATVCGIILTESDKVSNEFVLQKLLLVSLLGLPLFIALKMFADRYHWKYLKSFRLQTIGFFLLLLYYFILPEDIFALNKYAFQYALLFTCFLFLNAFLPYLKGKNIQGFWQYNKSMFLGFLIAMLYSQVMGIGLTIALAALDNLFNMEIDPKRYFQIWIIVSILFNSWVFMAKLPHNLDELENDFSYPKGLQIFIQYILLPLVGLYLVILYAYEIKILIEWNWPVGWVSNLVLWYSVVSILSLLLLHPLRELKENKWIQVFSKWFFRALIPLVAMLFLAIIQRISDYGITEPRYIVFAMAVGLVVVVLYFVISKSKDIRIIPIVICALAFISAFSVSAVSKKSQQSRLENLLIKNNLFVDSKLVKTDDEVDFDSRKEMSSIVDYLLNTHGIESFENWIDDSLIQNYKLEIEKKKSDSKTNTYYYSRDASEVCKILGFEYESRWRNEGLGISFNFNTDKLVPLDISGYDKFYQLSNVYNDVEPYKLSMDSLDCFIQVDQDNCTIALYIGDSLSTVDDLGELNLTDTLQVFRKRSNDALLAPKDLSFNFVGEHYEAKIVFYRINGNFKENETISSFDAILLLKKK